MTTLTKAQVAAKCVEISKCLLNTQVGLVNYDLCVSRSVGDATRFTVSVRQTGEIDPNTLAAISAALKIDFRITKSELLQLFEDLDWIEVRHSESRFWVARQKMEGE